MRKERFLEMKKLYSVLIVINTLTHCIIFLFLKFILPLQ